MNKGERLKPTDSVLRAQLEDLGQKATGYWTDYKTLPSSRGRGIAKERTFEVVQQMLSKVR